MSRHERTMSDGRLVVIGWDPGVESYFGQVYDPEPEGPCLDPSCELRAALGKHDRNECQDNEPVRWVGFGKAMGDELGTVHELAAALDPPEGPATGYGSWVLEMRLRLELDRRANPRTERSPAIQRLLDNLTGASDE